MVTTLSKIVGMIQSGAVPFWLREYVVANKEEIAHQLRQNGVYTFRSPVGEEITVRAERRAA